MHSLHLMLVHSYFPSTKTNSIMSLSKLITSQALDAREELLNLCCEVSADVGGRGRSGTEQQLNTGDVDKYGSRIRNAVIEVILKDDDVLKSYNVQKASKFDTVIFFQDKYITIKLNRWHDATESEIHCHSKHFMSTMIKGVYMGL